ncbi:SCO3374 family protein [Streptomyces zagrosensis]|uniref:Proline-rich protein n=1 Tax=Streptomyces zagrosensis TaxID=1042984 RepID=A0A7W9QFQ7_9ACTN|nr:SCO3374 family protein [Streptomyces zagrosensis]MBB5939413.1 hypothetical protein [Streptomyces zagrosensis]
MAASDPAAAPLPITRTPPSHPCAVGPHASQHAVREWYERVLGWPASPACEGPVQLLTGLRFDVLALPADAGDAVLRRVPRTGPVAVHGPTMLFLVAPGSADELPGLLDWLEWGGVPLELTALGIGGRMAAPAPIPAIVGERLGSRETATWVRPPRPGCEAGQTPPPREAQQPRQALQPQQPRQAQEALPSLGLRHGEGARGFHGLPDSAGMDGFQSDLHAPNLVRLVSAVATECHRARLLRVRRNDAGRAQPLAFSYASRTVAGTRPRSLTS